MGLPYPSKAGQAVDGGGDWTTALAVLRLVELGKIKGEPPDCAQGRAQAAGNKKPARGGLGTELLLKLLRKSRTKAISHFWRESEGECAAGSQFSTRSPISGTVYSAF